MPLDASGQQVAQVNPIQANMMARNFVIQQSVNMWQQIWQATYSGANTATLGLPVQVPLRQVGLVKRLLIRVKAIVQANGQTLTLCPFGPTQALSNIIFADLSNQLRINTPGWHIYGVASAKRRGLYGAAYLTDSPSGWGSNFPQVLAAPNSITTNPVDYNLFMDYEVPVSYTDMDLRGAQYMNVTNATSYVQFMINPNFFIPTGSDKTFGVYASNTATLGLVPQIQIEVYQNYLDQIPQAQNGGPVLPLLDMSTAYMLMNTPVGATISGMDIPIPYTNFRDYLSTFAVLDNGGVLNTGQDVNYWGLQSANFTNILKYGPQIAALLTRNVIGDDPPPGTYYWDHRDKPISTIQYGNQELILNGINLSPTGFCSMGYEMMALINMVTQAGSLYGTG